MEVGLVWESAVERRILMTKAAPHLVHPLAFMAPLNQSMGPYLGILSETGIRIGDLFRVAARSGRKDLRFAQRISATRALELMPGLRRSDLRGALLFWDGQIVDDSRLVVGLARTASSLDARVITYCEAVAV